MKKRLHPLDPRGRPEPYRAPDRTAWQERHGIHPFPAPNTPRLEGFAEIAREYINRDWESLSADECHGIHADLDILHDQVAHELGTESLVFFDPSDGQFWVYPPRISFASWTNRNS